MNKKTRLLRKKIIAKWNPVNIKNTSMVMQCLTDAMTYNSAVQINYKGSGWRSILPYGWNSSKAGNILLMCYKDTGEIRAYRIDRINDLLIDDNLIDNMPGDRPHEFNFNDFQIPQLPNLDEIVEETEQEQGSNIDENGNILKENKNPLPYDTGLEALTEDEVPDEEITEINPVQNDGENMPDNVENELEQNEDAEALDDNDSDENLDDDFNDDDFDEDLDENDFDEGSDNDFDEDSFDNDMFNNDNDENVNEDEDTDNENDDDNESFDEDIFNDDNDDNHEQDLNAAFDLDEK